jgi:hypothetical protein
MNFIKIWIFQPLNSQQISKSKMLMELSMFLVLLERMMSMDGCNHNNRNHNMSNQCLDFHVLLLKVVLMLQI